MTTDSVVVFETIPPGTRLQWEEQARSRVEQVTSSSRPPTMVFEIYQPTVDERMARLLEGRREFAARQAEN